MRLSSEKSPKTSNFGRAKARVLFSLLCLALAAGVLVPRGTYAADYTTGLVHWWRLDEAPGSTTAVDSAGGTTLTKQGNPDFAPGKINNAASFPAGGIGLNNYFEASTPANMQN